MFTESAQTWADVVRYGTSQPLDEMGKVLCAQSSMTTDMKVGIQMLKMNQMNLAHGILVSIDLII